MDDVESVEESVDLGPGLSVEGAFRAIVRTCCTEIDGHIAFVLDRDEATGPHKARVWLRRLVTALDAFEPVLKRKATAAFRKEAKGIFRQLGKLRDSDVLLEGMAEGQRSRKLLDAAARLRVKVRAKLRDANAVLFGPLFLRTVEDGSIFRTGPVAVLLRAEAIDRLAEAALDVAWEDCRKHRAKLAALAPTELHEFRKDLKTLRYQTEFFAPFLVSDRASAFRSELQRLQDLLGMATDAEAARALAGKAADKAERDAVRSAVARAEAFWRALVAEEPWWRVKRRDTMLH